MTADFMSMEDKINSLKCLRQDTLKTSVKLKKTITSQTNELINLLRERQNEFIYNVDELCLQQIWLCQDLLYKYQCSQPEDADASKYILTDQISNLSKDVPAYEAKFEELKSAIKSFGKITISPQLEKRMCADPPIFDLKKSRNKQMFIPSKQCSLSSNCSGESKTSLDSFEVIETIEACAEDHASQKHEDLDDLACKNPLLTATHVPDGSKCSSKTKMITDWLHKNDNNDEGCMIVTNISNDQKPLKKASKIIGPLQTIDSIESVSHATKPMKENSVTSNNRTTPNKDLRLLPKIEPAIYPTENRSCESFANKYDFKKWLNDSEFREDLIVLDSFSAIRDDLERWINNASSRDIETIKNWSISKYSKKVEKQNTPLCNLNSSPAKVVEQSFASYFVKNDHKEWLQSRMCV